MRTIFPVKRFIAYFHAKDWVESLVARAEEYTAKAVVISADLTSRPGSLGSPRVYLMVGANEFYQALPEGFDLDAVLNLLFESNEMRDPRSGPKGFDISFCVRIGQQNFQGIFCSNKTGIEIVLYTQSPC